MPSTARPRPPASWARCSAWRATGTTLAHAFDGVSFYVVGEGDQRLDELLRDHFTGLLGGGSEVTGELSGEPPGDGERLAGDVRRGCALLTELLPELGPGVLRHLGAVAPVRASSAMGSVLAAACGDVLPGTLIIDPGCLANPWEAAGHILHEALHLKFFDISRGGSMLAHAETPVRVPWRHQEWDVRRAFVSLHVYAHMMLFQAAATERGDDLAGEYGPRPNDRLAVGRGVAPGSLETVPGRTRHLAERLLGDLASSLTAEGRDMLVWLLSGVAPLLDWAPPVPRAGDRVPAEPRPPGPYTRSRELLARPCAESGRLLLFDRAAGRLHFLNLTTWLAFELCDGEADIGKRYADLLGGRVDAAGASALLDLALRELSRTTW